MTGFRAAIWSGVGGVTFGGLLGFAAVDGVRPQSVEAVPIYPRAAFSAGASGDMEPACAACTTYDDGYRRASQHGVTETDACFDDDWSRQSGCLAYVRASRPE